MSNISEMPTTNTVSTIHTVIVSFITKLIITIQIANKIFFEYPQTTG